MDIFWHYNTLGQLSRKSHHLVTAVTPAVLPKKMAARRQHFSREEVIKQVLVESEETEEDEVSLNDILETSISNFTALRRSMSNYTHFREEARQLMLNVYHRHEVGVHGMDKSLMSSLPAWPMIT